ncbi:MAG: CooT family nickel-binding protein [Candidatus Lokiarchaeota archaeon]|nr:CooT family nickel-binding protein [Candidatus Lokiarchaeota archaeon]MBD3200800.1 CooT family nickel-binding protein [Candidatus Lokiarchaeota archaeon]
MCEFKVKDLSDGAQLAEEIVVLSYSEDHELLLKDILGVSEKMDSALIYDVDTLDQTCSLIQHPLVNPFLTLIKKITQNQVEKSDIKALQEGLEELKKELE